MKFLGPTPHPRLNEAVAVVFLFTGLFVLISLVSYHPFDPSWNTATSVPKAANLTGAVGAFVADFCLQILGLTAYGIPVLILLMGWHWIRSSPIDAPSAKALGALMLLASTCTALGLGPAWKIANAVPASGLMGSVAADYLLSSMNLTGAALVTATCWIISLYLISKFQMSRLAGWSSGPRAMMTRLLTGLGSRWSAWREERSRRAQERTEKRALQKELAVSQPAQRENQSEEPPIVDPLAPAPPAADVRAMAALAVAALAPSERRDIPPWLEDIPIRPLESTPAPPAASAFTPPLFELVNAPPARAEREAPQTGARTRVEFALPPTALLQEHPARGAYDSIELKEIAARIKSKFEEFNVLGSVVQINPGPVVTTFEFKPEAGVKYSRITTLSEDLCLGLQAESILIERIPGKPTVGIEVPNSKREVISLRQILESEEFDGSASPLTVALGKDINGRIKIAALDAMPHLLIAGSTGSGKSVMLNSLIMSILYKATPHQVRMIMVDPKRLEFGLYEGIPHLLTPVITDAKKATNALRNAVLEMERRLKLLASQGVRNIDQFNKKVRTLQAKPRNLFEEEQSDEELEQIPYVLIVIDELADLMMLERANVEESVTRLAQMARAVGMHLVLATQRPSVDVITGLIKANFPSRISFRVATRVDSRTVLDVMGAEHLLGKGDMLFLPPGSSRLTRVHGAYVSEAETNRVVEFWKQQAEPDYDKTFLMAPPVDEDSGAEEFDGSEDPVYQEAVRVVLEMGKASTSTLQRRLRLGYGRAARILDMMQREGIIGPPDGSRPREVLKRPDWLEEVENQLK
jgi:DNA segregation ATPase FtsK/SpoIIIE, S-DNA-T family